MDALQRYVSKGEKLLYFGNAIEVCGLKIHATTKTELFSGMLKYLTKKDIERIKGRLGKVEVLGLEKLLKMKGEIYIVDGPKFIVPPKSNIIRKAFYKMLEEPQVFESFKRVCIELGEDEIFYSKIERLLERSLISKDITSDILEFLKKKLKSNEDIIKYCMLRKSIENGHYTVKKGYIKVDTDGHVFELKFSPKARISKIFNIDDSGRKLKFELYIDGIKVYEGNYEKLRLEGKENPLYDNLRGIVLSICWGASRWYHLQA